MIAELGGDERFLDIMASDDNLIGSVESWAENLLRRIASANPLGKIRNGQDAEESRA